MSSDFWSRRRAAVEAESEQDEKAKTKAALEAEQAALEHKTDEELLAQFDLPDPDTLKEGDDFTAFMAKAVPDRIRRRALRTLWKSNPVLANVDHLVEYGEDYTDGATVIENLQTAYQVGKGMLQHVEEMARQAEAEDALVEDTGDEETEDLSEVELADIEPTPAPEPAVEVEISEVAFAPRRMKFRIEETA